MHGSVTEQRRAVRVYGSCPAGDGFIRLNRYWRGEKTMVI